MPRQDIVVKGLTGDEKLSISYVDLDGGDIEIPILPSITLAASQVENQTYGIYEDTVGLIRTFRPAGADGFNLFLAGAGNNTMLPGDASQASYNIAVGRLSFISNTTGHDNVAVGYETLNANTIGSANVALGHQALRAHISADDNVAIGYKALYATTTGGQNTACGCAALIANVSGDGNTAVGIQSLRYNSTGVHNTAIGKWALWNYTTGNHNTAIGDSAVVGGGGEGTSTGSFNVGCGAYALYSCAGDSNVALGTTAGYYETGSNKLFIDNAARSDEADGRIKALIYGIFAAASVNQRLRINGRLGVTECPNYTNNTAALAGGLVSGEFYTVTGTDPLQVAKVI